MAMTSTHEIILNPDATAVTSKAITDTIHGLRTILEYLKEGRPLSKELAQNIIYIAEANVIDIAEGLAIEIDSADERKKRYEGIRTANMRIHALEQQLGQGVSSESVQAHIDVLSNRLKAWWRQDGFGFVPSLNFHSNGCEVKLSLRLSRHGSSFSKTPVTDKQTYEDWVQALTEKGYKLRVDGRDTSLIDCDSNRELVAELIRSVFPSVYFQEYVNSGNREGHFSLTEIGFYVHDYAEIAALGTKYDHVYG